jgi:hypothetical protein
MPDENKKQDEPKAETAAERRAREEREAAREQQRLDDLADQARRAFTVPSQFER